MEHGPVGLRARASPPLLLEKGEALVADYGALCQS